jgi:hypothetical protein
MIYFRLMRQVYVGFANPMRRAHKGFFDAWLQVPSRQGAEWTCAALRDTGKRMDNGQAYASHICRARNTVAGLRPNPTIYKQAMKVDNHLRAKTFFNERHVWMSVYSYDKLITETRRLASEFRRTTGQSLPVSGEIARYDAARLLDLTLHEPRSGGIDAIGNDNGQREGQRIQIKARIVTQEKKTGARLGQLNPDGEWDTVVLVLMDDDYEPTEIYEACRDVVMDALSAAATSKRARRGALSIAKFKNIGELVWTRENGPEGEIWSNR